MNNTIFGGHCQEKVKGRNRQKMSGPKQGPLAWSVLYGFVAASSAQVSTHQLFCPQ